MSDLAEGDGDSLRILRVATDLYPETVGGGALHAHSMSARQAARGHEVTVVTSRHGDRSLPVRAEREGYEVIRNRQLLKPFGNSITPGTVSSIASRIGEYDVVHAHSHLYFSTNVAALLGRLSDTPLVVTNHGLVSQTAPGIIQQAYLPTIGRATFESADCVLCYTDTDRDRLRERGVTVPISVIHNGIDCSTFRPMDGVPTQPQLLYVGRLKKSKGLGRLVETFAELAEAYPDLTVTIVGDGPMRDSLTERCERLGVADRVTFRGTVPNEDLPRVYNESRAFVLPSDAEGLPRTVLESLACGTPVVTSDLPQLESVVSGCGYRVPPESIDELAAAAERLLTDEATYQEFSERGRSRVEAEHSWAETVAETTAVYRELVSS
jgi:glycosyltransferase involved in cell wall biosynthesis